MFYYLIAGEASGDLHGSNLIKELKKRLQGELKSTPNNKRIKSLIKECDGWTCDCDICVDNI